MRDLEIMLEGDSQELIVRRTDATGHGGWTSTIDRAQLDSLIHTHGLSPAPEYQAFTSIEGVSTLLRSDEWSPASRRDRSWLIIKGTHDWDPDTLFALHLDWTTGRPEFIEAPTFICGELVTAAEVISAEFDFGDTVTLAVAGTEEPNCPSKILSKTHFTRPGFRSTPIVRADSTMTSLKLAGVEVDRPDSSQAHDLKPKCTACGGYHGDPIFLKIPHATECGHIHRVGEFVDAGFDEDELQLVYWVRSQLGSYSSYFERWDLSEEPTFVEQALMVTLADAHTGTAHSTEAWFDRFDDWFELYGYRPPSTL